MKNILIGFVLGYLVCTYVLQDLAGVESILTKAYTTLQGWFEYVILSHTTIYTKGLTLLL
jgi:hypothetical protein